MTRGKSLLFYLLVFAASLLIALAAVELVLRTLAFSTGDGGGRAALRWDAEHWKPINRQGFRDLEWQQPAGRPALVFVGDSFTDGHGVDFAQTYYYRTRSALGAQFATYNVGRSGASTRVEHANYVDFRRLTGIRPARVVWQYFGNDMQELLPPAPEWKPWPGLAFLSAHSELAELVWTYMAGVRWGRLYADHYLDGYADPAAFARHRADLDTMFKLVHADGASMTFLVFPYLDNDEYLRRSKAAYIEPMRVVFRADCRAGDAFIDATPLALEFRPEERTVNRLDGHPSPRLHARIAELLVRLMRGIPVNRAEGVEQCSRQADGAVPHG